MPADSKPIGKLSSIRKLLRKKAVTEPCRQSTSRATQPQVLNRFLRLTDEKSMNWKLFMSGLRFKTDRKRFRSSHFPLPSIKLFGRSSNYYELYLTVTL